MAVKPDPTKLLLPDDTVVKPFLKDEILPAFATALGIFSIFIQRRFSNRPVLSGIHHYFLAAAGFGGATYLMQERYKNYNRHKDAVYRHYIELHPDDFPMPESKKIGDLFLPWVPIR